MYYVPFVSFLIRLRICLKIGIKLRTVASGANVSSKPIGQRKLFNLLLIVALIISATGFIVDLHSTLTYPGSDLRSRVVGARLMLEGIDPYIFKWQPDLSEWFYDPLDLPPKLVSRLSVPPTVLALHAPIAGLSYLQQKVIWLLIQWISFVGTVAIFLNASRSRASTYLMLAISFFLPTVYLGAFI